MISNLQNPILTVTIRKIALRILTIWQLRRVVQIHLFAVNYLLISVDVHSTRGIHLIGSEVLILCKIYLLLTNVNLLLVANTSVV